ncbi:MAG TPA: gfo/Idh/MocA family oxidoreductase [Candidatus Latescibacteria bacterium]|jgi:predicted dehydrogenase|nr:gfo/Idh/MocA family oxidoreductase [Candidatus Latescibacterota bacterium]
MSNRIRIGFVGCGGITSAHLRGLRILREAGFDDFEVGALCSRSRENAERYVERGKGPAPLPVISPSATDPLSVRDVFVRDIQDHDPRIYTDYEEMLQEGAVDALVLLSAVSAHHPVALAAMERGLHVLIEKPFALTCRAATRMIDKAQQRGVALGVAENVRYAEGTRAAAWALRQGLIGDLQMVLAGGVGNIWSPDVIVAKTAWRHLKLEAGGGGTMDIGAHLFDRLRYVCGEIDEITAMARTVEPTRYTRNDDGGVVEETACDTDDTFFALLKFANGAMGNLLFSWAGHGEATGFDGGGALYGSGGAIKGNRLLVDAEPERELAKAFSEEADPAEWDRFFPRGVTDAFALELLEFLNAIEEGRQPETSGWEGLQDMAPCLAILESSSQRGTPVKIADVAACRVEGYQREINEHWGIE